MGDELIPTGVRIGAKANLTDALLGSSRQLGGSSILMWVGWAVVGLLVLGLVVGFIVPLFGNRRRYYSPFYYGGRSLRTRRAARENDILKLSLDVLPAIEKTR